MTLPIITYPNDILRKKAESIDPGQIRSPKIQRLITEMKETLTDNNGLGLAAPQIGESVRLIIVETPASPAGGPDGQLALINPQIIKKSWRKEINEEGCLSFPGVYRNIKRPLKVEVRAYDEQGRQLEISARGLAACEIQHEVDHLNGILIIDKK
ncbi:MAG: peptide deformylase [Parcubacteria group bacterium]